MSDLLSRIEYRWNWIWEDHPSIGLGFSINTWARTIFVDFLIGIFEARIVRSGNNG